uniref:Uncharacterized protein n=1 Tax=Romanomermis culicivorax TaxID=13658 RepID=A0A915I953_ROMCU
YVNSRRHKEIKSAWIVRSCQQGEEERRGSFIFRCQAQRMMPSACIMDDGSLTPIGSSYV